MTHFVDTLQRRRNYFGKGFLALPLIFAGFGLLSLVWVHALYGSVVSISWPPPDSGPTYWVLIMISFVFPIIIGLALISGKPLERLPVSAAVIILAFIGLLLATTIVGFSWFIGRVFVEVFLSLMLLLAYSVVLVHIHHIHPTVKDEHRDFMEHEQASEQYHESASKSAVRSARAKKK